MDAPHFQPAEDQLGMPVEQVIPTEHGAIVHYEMLYGPVRLGCPASSLPKQESVAEALAAFDQLAESHRAAARQRAAVPLAELCNANVGNGAKIRRCSYRVLPGTQYCGRHQERQSSSDDFEQAPALTDREDSFAF